MFSFTVLLLVLLVLVLVLVLLLLLLLSRPLFPSLALRDDAVLAAVIINVSRTPSLIQHSKRNAENARKDEKKSQLKNKTPKRKKKEHTKKR